MPKRSCLRQTMLRYGANEVALCAKDVLLRKNCGRDTRTRFKVIGNSEK